MPRVLEEGESVGIRNMLGPAPGVSSKTESGHSGPCSDSSRDDVLLRSQSSIYWEVELSDKLRNGETADHQSILLTSTVSCVPTRPDSVAKFESTSFKACVMFSTSSASVSRT